MESQSLSPSSRLRIGDLVALAHDCVPGRHGRLPPNQGGSDLRHRAGGRRLHAAVPSASCDLGVQFHDSLRARRVPHLGALRTFVRRLAPGGRSFPALASAASRECRGSGRPHGPEQRFVEFARHGLKAAHIVVTAQEQATAKHVIQPASFPKR